MKFLKGGSLEEMEMLGKQDEAIGKAVGVLKKLSWSERWRQGAEIQEKWRKDVNSWKKDAYKEGLSEGLTKGLTEGREEGIQIGEERTRKEEQKRAYEEKLNAARKLRSKGLDAGEIADTLNLPLDTVQRL
jgi:flagellar biosynthesis/type III secretory pathway protein FliH